MAKQSAPSNGHSRLEAALATLIQNQAAFVSSRAETNRVHAQFEREKAARFARIEAQMAEIIRVLAEHSRVLDRLPEAVREKVGFEPHN
jgi:hypothetical protein